MGVGVGGYFGLTEIVVLLLVAVVVAEERWEESVRSVICVSPIPTGWVSRSHGDTTIYYW